MILERFINEAKSLGIDHILASISSLNQKSMDFHLKNGFKECGRFPGIGEKFGNTFDMIWMQRQIWWPARQLLGLFLSSLPVVRVCFNPFFTGNFLQQHLTTYFPGWIFAVFLYNKTIPWRRTPYEEDRLLHAHTTRNAVYRWTPGWTHRLKRAL